MADFGPIVQMTLENEAGNPISTAVETDVNGKLVCMGITRDIFPEWFAGHPWPPDVAGATEFYRSAFWTPIQGDQIASQAIAGELFDFSVTAGSAHGVAVLQGLLGVEADGLVGPKTLAAVNAAPADLAPRFWDGLLAYYQGLTAPWAAACQAEWKSRLARNAKTLGVLWPST